MDPERREDYGKGEKLRPHEERDRKDPEQVLAELEKEFGDELNPALRRVLEEREAIQEWLREPENAAAFKREPVRTLRKRFPDLDLKKAVEGPVRVPVSLEGLDLGGADQATLDFFAEVWKYVCESEANANAFESNQRGTIALLGKGKPEHAVQRVTEAFRLSRSGGAASGPDLGRVAREAILHEVFDPIGPVEGFGESILTQLRLPPSEETRP